MAEIREALITIPYGQTYRERLSAVLGDTRQHWVLPHEREKVREALQVIDVALLHGPFGPRFLEGPKLRWIHCNQAGLNGCDLNQVFAKGLQVTSASGRSSPALAEHAIFFLLSLIYESPRLHAAQRARRWEPTSSFKHHSLAGRTAAILGMGSIGKEIATRLAALGVRVLGYDRDPAANHPILDSFFLESEGGLDRLLKQAECLVISLPLNNSTVDLIGERELSLLPKGCLLANVGRGQVVEEGAMIRALTTGQLGGAGLDVFETEPLPETHPLWTLPNVIITPHHTPPLRDKAERAFEILCDNIERYREGRPLRNLLRPEDIYTPPSKP